MVQPPSIQGNPEAVFIVDQLPSGEVLKVDLKRSSGNPGLDQAIERAIRKSSPLPKPDDPAFFQRSLEIKYKPFEE
jgi:colicin import membrane protein